MRRLLKFALLLGLANLLATVTAIVMFRHLDLRFSGFLEMLLIPAVQATVLIWMSAPAMKGQWRKALRELGTNRALLAILALDLAIFAIAMTVGLSLLWFVHGALAAALMFLVASRMRAGRSDMGWVCAFGIGLGFFALSYVNPWLAELPLIFGTGRTVIRWAVAYTPLFAIAILSLLKVGEILDRGTSSGGRYVDVSIACALIATLLVVSNIFFHPFLAEPWRSIEKFFSWLVMTNLILATASVFTQREVSNEAS